MNRVALLYNTHLSHPRYKGLATHLQGLLRSLYGIEADTFCAPSKDFRDHQCVLPMTVQDAEFVENSGLGKNALLSPVRLLKQLDDKAQLPQFEVFRKSSGLLPFVPTVQTARMGQSALTRFLRKYESFIVKKNTADVSTDQHRFTREELESLDFEQFQDFSLQPYLTPHSNYSCNFLCQDGVIDLESFHTYVIPEDFYKQSQVNLQYYLPYHAFMEYRFLDLTPKEFETFIRISKVFSHCATVCQDLKLTGMFNFEFLFHSEDEFYFLEVNPRYSGNVFCKDEDGNHPFLDKVIVPYIKKCGVQVPDTGKEKKFFSRVVYDTTNANLNSKDDEAETPKMSLPKANGVKAPEPRQAVFVDLRLEGEARRKC